MTSKNAKTILDFLARLALAYPYQTFIRLEEALEKNLKRWGYQMVADQIRLNPKETKLALFEEGRIYT